MQNSKLQVKSQKFTQKHLCVEFLHFELQF
jgi:hypothetical protein